MLVNDPPVADAGAPGELDAKVFGGKAMTYYGRWTYKFEIGAEKGAAGVLVIHETGPAGYPFQVVQDGFTGERFDLVTPDKNMKQASIEAWISMEQGQALLQMAGQNFATLKALAATRDFKPVPLGITASMTLTNKLRTVDSENVVARIEGSGPARKNEYVVYTAHWDHFGKRAGGIFHGAEDDALGCAALVELGRAFTKLASPPARSILFLAATAEEQGLLGSEYYTVRPIYPLAKTVADINLDSWNVSGRTKDVTLVGLGASDLDDYLREAAAEQGRIVHGDAEPEKGFYYRSDHFNFAKQGVPALAPEGGVDFIGKPEDYGRKVREEWTANRYHKPADVVRPDWDLTGMREDLKVYLAVGQRVAEARAFPEWRAGNEFKARRDKMLGK
jgi:Zn-dependent M28 family amino/carboxypeptidase